MYDMKMGFELCAAFALRYHIDRCIGWCSGCRDNVECVFILAASFLELTACDDVHVGSDRLAMFTFYRSENGLGAHAALLDILEERTVHLPCRIYLTVEILFVSPHQSAVVLTTTQRNAS